MFRMDIMVLILPVRNIIITIFMSVSIILHFSFNKKLRIVKLGILCLKLLMPIKKYKDLSPVGNKIWYLWENLLKLFFSIVGYSHIAICIFVARKASRVSRIGRKRIG